MITLLIRTSYRPVLFKRLLDSIYSQTYKNVKLIVSYDDERALSYIPDSVRKIKVEKSSELFFYDNYCNDLKKLVNEGWFMFIDDDEFLYDTTALERVSGHLSANHGVICQMNRGGNLKPSNELLKNKIIRRGKIGMPCVVLHHSHKNIVHFDGSVGAADYTFIKNLQKRVPFKFVPIVVAYCDRRSHGQME